MTLIERIKQKIAPSTSTGDEHDILDTLKQEHEEVNTMLMELCSTETAAKRKELLKQIRTALIPHVHAEEKVVYNAIIAQHEKISKVDGEEGYMEHELADEMMTKLGKMSDAMSPEFTAGAKVLKELVQHHVEEEERNVWRDVKKHFSEEERLSMNRKFEAAKKKVRVA